MTTQGYGEKQGRRTLEQKLSRVSVMSALTDDGSVTSQSSWRKYHDHESKSDYYYDEVTGESRWELPAGAALLPSPTKSPVQNDDYLGSLDAAPVDDDEESGDEEEGRNDSLYLSPESTKVKSTKNTLMQGMSRLAGSMAEVLKEDKSISKAMRNLQDRDGEEGANYFDTLKRDASIVSINGNWLQWLSLKGVTFYTSSGGIAQFEKPPVFDETEKMPQGTAETEENLDPPSMTVGGAESKFSTSLRELMQNSKDQTGSNTKKRVEVPILDLDMTSKPQENKSRFPPRMTPAKSSSKPPIGSIPAHVLKQSTKASADQIMSPLSGRSETGWGSNDADDGDDFFDPMRVGDSSFVGINSVKEIFSEMKARERMIDQETMKDEQEFKAKYVAQRQLPILQTLNDVSSLYQKDELSVDAKKVTANIKISIDTKSDKNKEKLRTSTAFIKSLRKIVESESEVSNTKIRPKAYKIGKPFGTRSFTSNEQRRTKNWSRPHSLFKTSAMDFLAEYTNEEVEEINSALNTEEQASSNTGIHDPQWEESLIFLDRLRRMDITSLVEKEEAKIISAEGMLERIKRKFRKARAKAEKSSAFSATGRNVTRTFAPGVRGVQSHVFDEETELDEEAILRSSIPSNFMKNFAQMKIHPKILSHVGKANPIPIVGISKGMRLGDLMSKIQTAKMREDLDEMRARRAMALDHLRGEHAERRKVAYDCKQQGEYAKDCIREMNVLVDDGDASWLYAEISRRHLIEAAALLESSLIRPRNRLDRPAYCEIPEHLRCPGILAVQELLKSCALDGTISVEHDHRYAKIILTRKDTLKSSAAARKKLLPLDDGVGNPSVKSFYVHKNSRASQGGEPFDKKFRDIYMVDMARVDNGLSEGKRIQDIYRDLLPVKKSLLRSGPIFDHEDWQFSDIVHIYSDSFGGLLFYCPLRNAFFCSEHPDPSIGFYETEHGDHGSKRVAAYKQSYKNTSLGKKNSEHVSIWTKLSLNPICLPKEEVVEEVPVEELKASEDDEYFQNLQRILRETVSTQASTLVKSASETAIERVSGSPIHFDVDDDEEVEEEFKDSNHLDGTVAFAVTTKDISPKPKKTKKNEDLSRDKLSFFTYQLEKKEKAILAERESLTFEAYIDEIEDEENPIYVPLLVSLYRKPRDMTCLLRLSKYLLSVGCSKESFVTLVRAIECSEYPENVILEHEISLLQILAAKMAAKYLNDYTKHDLLRLCAKACPDSQQVLGVVARLLHKLRVSKQAEELYLGALLLDPLSADALRGYALMLAEAGNWPLACKYISRVESHSLSYSAAKTEKGWMHECLGDFDASFLAYQHVMTLCLKDKPTSNSFSALGHLYHVRGEYGRALSFYRRAITTWKNNPIALVLRGCLGATVISLPEGSQASLNSDNYGNTELPDTIDQVCSLFRRGLAFLKGGSRWIGLLSYGEVIAYHLKDLIRAEMVLWDAVKLSVGRTVWAAIALLHFYQYARNDYISANDVYEYMKLLRFTRAKVEPNTVDDYVASQVVLSHLRMELGDMDGAHDAAMQALDSDETNSPALRSLALIAWLVDEKDRAMKYIQRAITSATSAKKPSINVYSHRVASVMFAMKGRYAEALATMQTAVSAGGASCPLAWRALGIMMYHYGSPLEAENRNDVLARSAVYLERANTLANGTDFAAALLQGQILMELERFYEAEKVLRQALRYSPGHPVILGTLALCLSALGFISPIGIDKVDYSLMIRRMKSVYDLINVYDAELLFEAATSPTLMAELHAKTDKAAESVAQNTFDTLNLPSSGDKSKFVSRVIPTDGLFFIEPIPPSDAPPGVLFWYGMYMLRKYTTKKDPTISKAKARELFERAAVRTDCEPYPLAIYMVGWMAELDDDFDGAEQCYCYAMQAENMHPEVLLRLAVLVTDTLNYIKKLTAASEMRDQRLRKAKEYNRRVTKFGYSDQDEEEMTLVKQDIDDLDEEDEEDDVFYDGADERLAEGGPTESWKLDGENVASKKKSTKLKKKKSKSGKFRVPDLPTMRKRLVIHDRVTQLCALRCNKMMGYLHGLNTPGKYVLVDPMWMSRLLEAFSVCDDWAALLKSSHTFRG